MSKKIVFRVSKEGNVVIDKVEGYGSSCKDATQLLERALGKADEGSRKLTEEFNEPVSVDLTEKISH
jgi:hypothetical protein